MMMRIGTSTIDITPPQPGAELGGFLFRVQPSLGVHDPLLARCVYLEHDAQRLLWIHADLIGFTDGFVAELRRWAGRELGLRADRVLVSATHTHSGPATVALGGCGEEDPGYTCWLRRKLELGAAAAATGETEPVRLVAGESRCDLAMDRRRGTASAHVDPRVGVIGFRREDGSFAAVFANYAMHNVALGHDNRQISGDVAGCAARRLTCHLRGFPAVVFTAGAAGNVNPPKVGVDFAQADAWGDVLAQKVLEALEKGQPDPTATLRSRTARFDVPLQRADQSWLDRARDRALAPMRGRSGYEADRYLTAVEGWHLRMSELGKSGRLPASVPVELQVVEIGRTTLVCVNAEIFSRFADDLRDATGRAPLYVVGYANGLVGYVPTAPAFDEGGYETDNAFIFYGGVPVRPETFDMVRARAADLVRSMPAAELQESSA